MVYNYDSGVFATQQLEEGQDQRLLWDVSSLISSVLFNVENLQGVLADNDLLGAQFNLVNEGVVMLNAELSITKMNKSAEILLNTTSAVTVGKRITEILGANNNHLMKPITEVSSTKPYTCLTKTQITSAKGSSEAGGPAGKE